MKTSPPTQLGTLGQSIWLDYIRKDLITGGELRRLIKNDGLRGITSNPSIFSFVPAVCMARAGVIL